MTSPTRRPCFDRPLRSSLALVLLVASLAGWPAAAAAQGSARTGCSETNECRRMALEAAARGAYETFHDLVWRAIQTGRPNDPELLFLLARAQSLSNRPHDALVVLRRLADMGTVYDAISNEDLSRARRLPGWPALEALIRRVEASNKPAPPAAAAAPSPPAAPARPAANASGAPAVPPVRAGVPSPAPAPAAPIRPATPAVTEVPAPATPAPPASEAAGEKIASASPPPSAALPAPASPAAAARVAPLPVEEALRFSAKGFVPGGLAYDAVSARFILGSAEARSLLVVGDGTSSVSDLVRAESAGFKDVAAVEIDRRRGDLWVVSAGGDGGGGALHKLQLISGRSLATFDVAAGTGSVRLADVAVTAAGTVLVLDAGGGRILRLPSGGRAIEEVVQLEAGAAVSVAATDDERRAYVALPSAVLRVDLTGGGATAVTAPPGTVLDGIERIRWHRGALIAVQAVPGGGRRIVRLALNSAGRAIVSSTVLSEILPTGGPTFATVAGDDLYFLDPAAGGGTADVVVHRMRLR